MVQGSNVLEFLDSLYNQLRYCNISRSNVEVPSNLPIMTDTFLADSSAAHKDQIDLNRVCSNDLKWRYSRYSDLLAVSQSNDKRAFSSSRRKSRTRRHLNDIISQLGNYDINEYTEIRIDGQPPAPKRKRTYSNYTVPCLGFSAAADLRAHGSGRVNTCSCLSGTVSTYQNPAGLVAVGYSESLAQELSSVNTCVLKPCQWDTPLYVNDNTANGSVDDLNFHNIPSYEPANRWISSKGCHCAADRGWIGVNATSLEDSNYNPDSSSNNSGVIAPFYANMCIHVAVTDDLTVRDWLPIELNIDLSSSTNVGRTKRDGLTAFRANAASGGNVNRTATPLKGAKAFFANMLKPNSVSTSVYDSNNAAGLSEGTDLSYTIPVLAAKFSHTNSLINRDFYFGFSTAFQLKAVTGTEHLHAYPANASSFKFTWFLAQLMNRPPNIRSQEHDGLDCLHIVVQEPAELCKGNNSWFNRVMLLLDWEHSSGGGDISQQKKQRHIRLFRTTVDKDPPEYHWKCPPPRSSKCSDFSLGARQRRRCYRAGESACMVTASWANDGKAAYEDFVLQHSKAGAHSLPLCSTVEQNALVDELYYQQIFGRVQVLPPFAPHRKSLIDYGDSILLEDRLRQLPIRQTLYPEWYDDVTEIIRRVSSQTPVCILSKQDRLDTNLYENGTLVPSPLSARTRNVAGVCWQYMLPVDNSTYPGNVLAICPLARAAAETFYNIPSE